MQLNNDSAVSKKYLEFFSSVLQLVVTMHKNFRIYEIEFKNKYQTLNEVKNSKWNTLKEVFVAAEKFQGNRNKKEVGDRSFSI